MRSIIDLAHSLDYSVVAEGIEAGQAYDLLTAWGCNEGQGCFMSWPLSGERFTGWLVVLRTY